MIYASYIGYLLLGDIQERGGGLGLGGDLEGRVYTLE
jgi:hypothetical protein